MFKINSTSKLFLILIIAICNLLSSCGSSQNFEPPLDYSKDELARYFHISNSELSNVFQGQLTRFDNKVQLAPKVEILNDNKLKDSLRGLSDLFKTQYTLNQYRLPYFDQIRNKQKQIKISKVKFLEYWNTINKKEQKQLIYRLKSIESVGEFVFLDKDLSAFISKEFSVIVNNFNAQEKARHVVYEQLFYKTPQQIDNILNHFDTLTTSSGWGNKSALMLIAIEVGHIDKIYENFERLTLEMIEKRNEPYIKDYGYRILQNQALMLKFARSKNKNIRNRFIELAFDQTRNKFYGIDSYPVIPSMLLNSHALTDDKRNEYLEILRNHEYSRLQGLARIFDTRLNGISKLKNQDSEYIKEFNIHTVTELLATDLYKDDKAFLYQFIDNNPENFLKGGKCIDWKSCWPYVNLGLTTTNDFDTIKYYMAAVGLTDNINYNDFIAKYELAAKSSIFDQPFNKNFLINHIINTELGSIEYNKGYSNWPHYYNGTLLDCSRGIQKEFDESLHFWVETVTDKNGDNTSKSYNAYVFTNESSIYKCNLPPGTNYQPSQIAPIIDCLNLILKEAKKTKRFMPIGNDAYFYRYWLIEPAAISFLNDKIGIY